MNPLDEGDAGGLGSVFDSITGAVHSVERLGQTVNTVTTFSMTVAMIWAIILFMFFSLLVRLLRAWNDAAAERYRTDRPVFPPRQTSPHGRSDPDNRIEDLEARLAQAMLIIEELRGERAPAREPEGVA
jgi:hypothetical protein